MYALGVGVERNQKEAVKWLKLAADQGDETSQFNLARRYLKGSGVSIDKVEAYVWYWKASKNKDAAEELSQLKKIMSEPELAVAQDRVAALKLKK
jgi:TPR repeat protein